jgi:branched-chain amino acid transport system substrate-binding protein
MGNVRFIRAGRILLSVMLALGLSVGVSRAEMKTLKVSSIMPFSGGFGFYGEALKPGMEIYAEILNDDGGVKIGNDTYKIEMIFVDDAADPKRGPQAAQDAIQKGAVANVGCFSLAAPIAAVLTPAKVLFVSQMQDGVDLKQHRYFIGANDAVLAPVYAHYAALEMWPDAKKIGFLVYDWQKVQAQHVIDIMSKPDTPFTKRKLAISLEVIPMGNSDFTIPLSKFKEAGVDSMFTFIGPGDYALVSKQAAEQGLKLRFFNAGTATDMKEFINMAGQKNAQGMGFNWPAPWAIRKSQVDPELRNMAVRISYRFAEKYGKPMTYLGGFDWGINHTRILLDFYQQAGTLDPEKVMEKVRGGQVKDFTGTWTMGGTKTWGAPVVKASACLDGVIRGTEVVYGAEYPMPTIPRASEALSSRPARA